MLSENTKVRGTLQFELRDAAGNVKQFIEENLVVNLGLAAIAKRMIDDAEGKVTHMAVGTDSTAAVGTQTALSTELTRVVLQASTNVTGVVANDSARFVAEFGPGVGTGALREAGLFANTTMWARSVFADLNKAADDTLTISWNIRIGAGV